MRRLPRRLAPKLTWLRGYAYLLPFLLSVCVFTLYPVLNVILISFKEGYSSISGSFDSLGFGNYVKVVSDPYFHQALANTGIYALIVVPTSTVLSILFANLINKKLKFTGVFQTAYFLPLVTSTIAVGLAWHWMYNGDYGIVNYLISLVGVKKIEWLTDARYGLAAMCIFGVWSMMPFTIIIILSGLQGIDERLRIAARVDGASSTQIFFKIVLPLLTPTVSLVMVINTINAFKVFQELFPLFNGEPGVSYSLYTVVYYIYDMFYSKWHFDIACAAAVIMLIILVILTRIQTCIRKSLHR